MIFEQKKTIETLIKESSANAEFYLMLVEASVIATISILMDNAVIVIGGMSVAPASNHPLI